MSDTDEKLEAGTVLELARRYRIESFLGAGGFAQVYRAREMGIDRSVALKLLDVGPRISKSHKQRFFREAQAAARIGHPDVVTVHEHGVAPDGRPYIAQEFLDGRDLSEELTLAGPMSPQRAVPLFVRVLDALAAAHEVGVAHRDLKPPNLFLDRAGTRRERMVILDFGVACFFDQLDDRLTATGGFLGTPRYMAPEYIERRQIGPAMDVYQMGLVLVEALSGQSPVIADNAYQSMVAHVRGNLQVPAWIDNGPIGPIVRSALDRDPDARLTAAQLRDRLDDLDHTALDRESALAASSPGSLGSAPTGSSFDVDVADLAIDVTADGVRDAAPDAVLSLYRDDGDPTTPSSPFDPEPSSTGLAVPPDSQPPLPPPLPYSARRTPETEALSLTGLIDAHGEPVVDILMPPRPPTLPAETLAVMPARRLPRRWWFAAIAVFVIGLAGAVYALRFEPELMGATAVDVVPGGDADVDADVVDADVIDAAVDAAVDARVDARSPPRPAPDVRRVPTEPSRAAARPMVRPAVSPPKPPSEPPTNPTARELLEWRRGLTPSSPENRPD